MRKLLEEKWVSLIDSKPYRDLTQRKVVSRIIKGKLYQNANYYRRFLLTYYKANSFPEFFTGVENFCVFLGQTKSGSSMVGGLLDSHPNIIISDEANALKLVENGLSRDQLFHLLLHVSKREMMKGRVTARRLVPYSFLVPDQWQGRYSKLITIGDSTAAKSTQNLARNPELVQNLELMMNGMQVKYIQVVKNPFDPISIMMIRGKRTFENAMNHYFADCETLEFLRKTLITKNIYSIRYEDFIQSPGLELSNLCKFLGVEIPDGYIEACTQILFNSPERSRELIDWDQSWIDKVHAKIVQYDFLDGYSYWN